MQSIEFYPVLVRELSGRYFAVCQTFNIVTENVDLEEAYKQVIQLRNIAMEKYKKLGLPNPHPSAFQSRARFSWLHDYLYFLVKTASILAIVALTLGPIIKPMASTVRQFSMTFEKMIPAVAIKDPKDSVILLGQVANTLDAVTSERREEVIIKLRSIVHNIKPFYDEIALLFKPEVNQPLIQTEDIP